MKQNIFFLFLGCVFLFFGNGRFFIPIATWIFPIFFLQVLRKKKEARYLLLIPFSFGIVSQFSFWKFSHSNPKSILFYIPFFLGLCLGSLFLIEKFIPKDKKDFASTLILPLVYTSFEFLLNLVNPFGTTGSLAYTQFRFLEFANLSSITGIWGITFMITWFSSIVVWAFQILDKKKELIRGISIYFTIFSIIILYGYFRPTIANSPDTVKISGIHVHDKDVEVKEMWDAISRNDFEGFQKLSNQVIEKYLQKTNEEVRSGSKIIVWSEISPLILKKDSEKYDKLFQKLALEQKIHLINSPFLYDPEKSENRGNLYSPKGILEFSHMKYGGSFLEGTTPGNKVLQTIPTEFGNITILVCWDADFPSVIRQAYHLKTNLLLIPSSDWKEIDPLHSIPALFRGIENGTSVLRQTQNGLSFIADGKGNIISQMDHFQTRNWSMTGNIPTKRYFSIYPYIGDLFGWICVFSLLAYLGKIGWKKLKKKRK